MQFSVPGTTEVEAKRPLPPWPAGNQVFRLVSWDEIDGFDLGQFFAEQNNS